MCISSSIAPTGLLMLNLTIFGKKKLKLINTSNKKAIYKYKYKRKTSNSPNIMVKQKVPLQFIPGKVFRTKSLFFWCILMWFEWIWQWFLSEITHSVLQTSGNQGFWVGKINIRIGLPKTPISWATVSSLLRSGKAQRSNWVWEILALWPCGNMSTGRKI